MSLKELTKEIHTAAEHTPFMQAVFKGKMPAGVWADYTYQKSIIYSSIESVCRDAGYTVDCLDVERALKLYQDTKEMCGGNFPRLRPETIEYSRYLLDLAGDGDKILGHLYTWHLGDLHGGQMIKKVMPQFPHRNLDFNDVEDTKVKIRALLNDGIGDEAIKAFEWAIKLMHTYDSELV